MALRTPERITRLARSDSPRAESCAWTLSEAILRLGHEQVETTRVYLYADLKLKEQALARTTPPNGKPGRYRPPDSMLAFFEDL